MVVFLLSYAWKCHCMVIIVTYLVRDCSLHAPFRCYNKYSGQFVQCHVFKLLAVMFARDGSRSV